MFLKKYRIIVLGSQTMENNEFLLKHIIAMHWTHQIALCHQPCHEGFTAKITVLQIWFVWSTMSRRIYSEDY